ncbi:MAG: hypothetical protein GY931_17780 [Maribacter sp.]|nr:hypothetical protein [Maribacter sp.]
MSELEVHIQELFKWVRTLEGCPQNWNGVQIIEDPSFSIRGKVWKVPKESLKSIKEYEGRFEELLEKGYSWININFGGIYNDNAIVFIEYPNQSSGLPKDKVPVVPSGPFGHEWDLSNKLCIIK